MLLNYLSYTHTHTLAHTEFHTQTHNGSEDCFQKWPNTFGRLKNLAIYD